MKKILTFLILSTFYFSAKANSISSDSTVCPIISNLEIYVDEITAEVYIRNFAVKKSNYDVQYKVDSVLETTWINGNTNDKLGDSSITKIKNLQLCKQYVLRIRTLCSDGQYSAWQAFNFLTKGCPLPCTTITNVRFSSVDSILAPKPTGNMYVYADFTGRNNVFIETKPDDNSYSAWVKNPSPNYNIITGLKICQNYSARLISSCYDNPTQFDTTPVYHFSTPCFNKFSCVPPKFDQQAIGYLQYALNTDEIGKYEVQYKLATDSNWIESDTILIYASEKKEGAVYINLKNLKLCNNYNERIRTLCLNNNSDWITRDFKSSGCQPSCQKIDSVWFNFSDTTIQNILIYTARVFWKFSTDNYSVEYKPSNSTTWLNGNYSYLDNL